MCIYMKVVQTWTRLYGSVSVCLSVGRRGYCIRLHKDTYVSSIRVCRCMS